MLKGEISVLFLVHVKVDIAVELWFGVVRSVNALVAVAPINLGPLKFTSTLSRFSGPKFQMKATLVPKPFFNMSIDGKLQITFIGFSRSVFCKIDEKGLHIATSGKMFGFGVSFTLKAQFKNIRQPKTFKGFYIAGRFTTMASKLINGVKNTLQAASRKLNQKLNAAHRRLVELDKKFCQGIANI